MKAIFKDNNDLIINLADDNERIILEDFNDKYNSGEYDLEFHKTLNINGDIDGMVIQLKEKEQPEPNVEPTEDDSTEEPTEEISE